MGLSENWNFNGILTYQALISFLALKNPVLKFLNFLSSRALLSYEPFSYKEKKCVSDLGIKVQALGGKTYWLFQGLLYSKF